MRSPAGPPPRAGARALRRRHRRQGPRLRRRRRPARIALLRAARLGVRPRRAARRVLDRAAGADRRLRRALASRGRRAQRWPTRSWTRASPRCPPCPRLGGHRLETARPATAPAAVLARDAATRAAAPGRAGGGERDRGSGRCDGLAPHLRRARAGRDRQRVRRDRSRSGPPSGSCCACWPRRWRC